MHLNSIRVVACLPLFFSLIVGCSKHPATAPAGGSVSFDGEPLKFGSVMFQPAAGGQPARGEIQPDGTFTLSTFEEGDGAIVGKHRVRIMCSTAQDPSKPPPELGNQVSVGKLLIPRKYTQLSSSGLTAEVQPESNQPFAFQLKKVRHLKK